MTRAEQFSAIIIHAALDKSTTAISIDSRWDEVLPGDLVMLHTLRGTLAVVRAIVNVRGTEGVPSGASSSASSSFSATSTMLMPYTSASTTTAGDSADIALITKIELIELFRKTRVHGGGYARWIEQRKWIVEALVKRKNLRRSEPLMDRMRRFIPPGSP